MSVLGLGGDGSRRANVKRAVGPAVRASVEGVLEGTPAHGAREAALVPVLFPGRRVRRARRRQFVTTTRKPGVHMTRRGAYLVHCHKDLSVDGLAAAGAVKARRPVFKTRMSLQVVCMCRVGVV